MDITEIRIMKKEDQTKKLRAFVNVTFDESFVVRDMKVVEGSKGLFVAMPSRRLKVNCPQCRYKISIGSRFCSHCGAKLPDLRGEVRGGKDSGHKDIAHPITLEFREKLQQVILDAYNQQTDASDERPRQEAKPSSEGGSEDRPSMSVQDDEY